MPSKLDDLLPAIVAGGDSGVTEGTLKTKFAGKSTHKARKILLTALQEKLAALGREGLIWGPLKFGPSDIYFATGRGPSIETASTAIVGLISKSGVKLLSKAKLEEKVIGKNARFFVDGLKHATSTRAIVELSCGSSKYYLHRDVAADYFGFEVTALDSPNPSPQPGPPEPSPTPRLTLETLLPAYRRLKAEQGGFSAVKIFDLMHAVSGSKEDLHRLLIEETKAGRVTIHPTTTVELPKEVIDAGIRLPGFPEPFVTVVVKSEP
jgi:hypothetical protein